MIRRLSVVRSPQPTPKALNNKAQGREAHPGEPGLRAKNPERVLPRRIDMRSPNPRGHRAGPFVSKTPTGFNVVLIFYTQGALRDPGLWSITASRYLSRCGERLR